MVVMDVDVACGQRGVVVNVVWQSTWHGRGCRRHRPRPRPGLALREHWQRNEVGWWWCSTTTHIPEVCDSTTIYDLLSSAHIPEQGEG